MRSWYAFSVVLMAFFSFAILPCTAQTEMGQETYNPVVTGAPILTITPDARSAGMGEVGLTTTADAFSIYHNISKLASIDSEWGLSLGYTPWMTEVAKDISLSTLTGYYHWGNLGEINHAVGASFRYFHIGKTNAFERNAYMPITIVPYELALDVGYSIAFDRHWSVGASLRYLKSDFNYSVDNVKSQVNNCLGDLSLTYQTRWRFSDSADADFRTAIALNNVGGAMSYDGGAYYLYAPTTLRIGVGLDTRINGQNAIGVHLEANKVLAPTLTAKDRKNPAPYNALGMWRAMTQSFGDAEGGAREELREVVWAVGAEYRFDEWFFVRSGYHYQHKSKGTNSGFSLGLGVIYKWATIDMAYFLATQNHSPLNNTFRLSVGINF